MRPGLLLETRHTTTQHVTRDLTRDHCQVKELLRELQESGREVQARPLHSSNEPSLTSNAIASTIIQLGI